MAHVRIANIDTSTSQGLAKAFRHGATECLFNAEALAKGETADLTGHYIITLHAIELGLKAYLAKTGLTERELRTKPYGHDLVYLYDEAVRRGLALNVPHADKTLRSLNAYHQKPVLRYDFAETRELPRCCALFPIISTILDAVRT
jgi:hypothetical protein